MGYRIGIPVHVSSHGVDDGVVSAVPCTLYSVLVGKVAAGETLKVYDCAATGDVGAGNLKASIELDTRDAYPFGTDGAQFRTGLVAVLSGGSPDVTVVIG